MGEIKDINSKEFRIPRIKSVDFLRGFAVVIMLEFHFANIFVIRSILEPVTIIHFLGIVGAPIFLLIVGMSVVLSKNIRLQRGQSEKEIKNHIFKRGLVIILLHYLLGASIFGFSAIWGWGILSLIGASVIISLYISKCSEKILWVLAIGVIIASPVLRVILNYQIDIAYYFDFNTYMPITTYLSPWDILAFIRSILITPGFPIFPHIFFVIIGVWLGNSVLEHLKKNSIIPLLKKLVKLGVIFIIMGFFIELLSNIFPLTPADKMVGNTGYNFWTLGIVFLCFAFFYWIQDIKRKDLQIFRSITFLGKISLTILFIHAFFAWYLVPVLGGFNNITLFSSYIISFAFYVAIWIFGGLWEKSNFKFSLRWIIGKLS
ncbi:MAG: heparan-alpha-glucosaminide N-acetyltransferase domain-containing protein [Candidatus Helarchaeota archaeon]